MSAGRCDRCGKRGHRAGSTLCGYLSPETIAWLQEPVSEDARAVAARTIADAQEVEQ